MICLSSVCGAVRSNRKNDNREQTIRFQIKGLDSFREVIKGPSERATVPPFNRQRYAITPRNSISTIDDLILASGVKHREEPGAEVLFLFPHRRGFRFLLPSFFRALSFADRLMI